MTLVASDLDRTLIYSAASLQLTMPDAQAPRLLCVEVYGGAPLCYMTETAAALLDGLARTTVFVPTTTRTREQYGRIHLPGPAPGTPSVPTADTSWSTASPTGTGRTTWSAGSPHECASLGEVRAHIQAAGHPSWLLKERVAEDLFAYLVVDRAALPEGWVKELSDWADLKGWTVSLQGRKVYAVPKPLTKSAAMREVARRCGATLTLAAGDSLLDADLLLAADRAWRPGHGELADCGWGAPNTEVLRERGGAAGEEILRRFVRAADPLRAGR